MPESWAGEAPRSPRWATFQVTALIALRMLIGWHFLYEGLTKIASPYWTSAGYLAESRWLLRGLFISIASSPTAVTIVDYLNMWGLTLIGLGLIAGFLTRTATAAAIGLLALYYLATPPWIGYTYAMPMEGSYLIVNKILIELAAVVVLLAFPTGKTFGLDWLVARWRAPAAAPAAGTRVAQESVS
jgi:thiosulfate dehydrogenase [quinone] large subunit